MKKKLSFIVILMLSLVLLFSNSTPTLSSVNSGRFYSGQILSSALDVALGDLDSDGDIDAVLALSPAPGCAVWMNDGLGNFTLAQHLQEPGSDESSAVALGDLDGDGDLDIVLEQLMLHGWIYLNDGQGNFSISNSRIEATLFITDIALGDLDGDGDLDALVGTTNGPSDQVHLNDGLGNFTYDNQALGYAYTNCVELGDLNGDGYLDAVVAPKYYDRIDYWLNDGAGSLEYFHKQIHFPDLGWSEAVALGDLDGDGDLDMFVCTTASDLIAVFINDGQGNFVLYQVQPPGSGNNNSVALGDLDNDGDLDAVVGLEWNMTVWLNNGAGWFMERTQPPQIVGNGNAIALGDFDFDGYLDVIEASTDPVGSIVWFNNCIPEAYDDVYSSMPGVTLIVDAPGVLANDIERDYDDFIIVSSYDQPAYGSVMVNPDGSFTYTPNSRFIGNDSFSYTIMDTRGDISSAVVSLIVDPNKYAEKNLDIELLFQLPTKDWTLYHFGTTLGGLPVEVEKHAAFGLRAVQGQGLVQDEISDNANFYAAGPGHLRVLVNLENTDEYHTFIFVVEYNDAGILRYDTIFVENENCPLHNLK